MDYINKVQSSLGKGGGGGGGGGFQNARIMIPEGLATGEETTEIDPAFAGDYLGAYADLLEDNNLVDILGLDKDLAAAIEEYDEFLSKLEDTKDTLE